MYCIWADPMLDLGTVAVRRVPYLCTGCANQLSLPWGNNVEPHLQGRYAKGNTVCVYHSLFEDMNDWQIITCKPTSANDNKETDLA